LRWRDFNRIIILLMPTPDNRMPLDLNLRTLATRNLLLDAMHQSALRLFNGFYEGLPELVVDLYARTLVLYNYAANPADFAPHIQVCQQYLLEQLPWVQSVIVKTRASPNPAERNGILTHGQQPDRRIQENGVAYAVDLQMNQDTSFYLDTRHLRAWLKERLAGKSLLNTFAYTGSLGVAALAGGARQVIQHDRSQRFLNLAKESCALNSFPIRKADYLAGEFHAVTARLRRAAVTFDCVILDPPFFSDTRSGRVDLQNEYDRLINKVRPLVAHGGWLVAINNALFLPGAEYISLLERLGADGYLQLEEIIPVPEDVAGFGVVSVPPADPAPFNHPTKIAILRVI
jgi:23S rRNA (cytosine1962-C5)-methyltransferase